MQIIGIARARMAATEKQRTRLSFRGFLLGLLLLVLSPVLPLTHCVKAQLIPSFGSTRAGTAGLSFLKVTADARAAAMGETVVTNATDASSLFWNPALAARAPGHQIGFSHGLYFVDTNVDYLGAIYHLPRGGLTVGASLQAFNSGEMDVTTTYEREGTGETFRLVSVAAGLTVAQSLTDLFSYGVTAKYVRESVVDLAAQTVVFDLGMFYRVGDTGAEMAVAIRNFGLDAALEGELEREAPPGSAEPVEVEDDFESLTPPTTFLLGVSYRLLRDNPRNSLLLTGQLTNPNDYAESFNVGAEYVWNRFLMIRGGYRLGVDEFSWPSWGVGLMLPELAEFVEARFDYGYTRLDRLGTIHRVGLNLSL